MGITAQTQHHLDLFFLLLSLYIVDHVKSDLILGINQSTERQSTQRKYSEA